MTKTAVKLQDNDDDYNGDGNNSDSDGHDTASIMVEDERKMLR